MALALTLLSFLPAVLRGSSLWPEPRGPSKNPGRGEAGPADRRLPVAHRRLGRGGQAVPARAPRGDCWVSQRGASLFPHVGWAGPHTLLPAPNTHKVFSLPPSVLRCSAREPVGTEGAYKAAVDSFLQQHHALGEEKQSRPCPQHPQGRAGLPTASQTEALSRLFNSVKTLTAKEELLQTLR